MRIERTHIHPMAARAVEGLAQDGYVCTPDDIVWLNALAVDIGEPTRRGEPLEWIDLPYDVCGVKLWPLSIGAEIWVQECAAAWFAGNEYCEIAAIAWAMAHSRDRDVFVGAATKREALRAINAWLKRVPCSWRALKNAVDRIIGVRESVELDAGAMQEATHPAPAEEWGDVIAILCHANPGSDPKEWFWNYTGEQIYDAVSRIARMEGGKDADVSPAKVRAQAAFNTAVRSMRKQAVTHE